MPKPKQTAAQKRGIGAGHAAGLGMSDAYTRDKRVFTGDILPCCGCTFGTLAKVPTEEECSCYCHETPRWAAKFRL